MVVPPEAGPTHAHDGHEDDRARRTLERSKELDHAHRTRVRSIWQSGFGLVISLRFLRTTLRRLVTPTRRRAPARVARPPAGEMAVTFVGHATVMMTTARARVLTDPLFANFLSGLRRAEAACLAPADAAEVNLILLSHAHRDHLHPASLRRLPQSATVVVPPRCASVIEPLGFARVVVLEPGESLAHEDLIVTAVAARHDGGRALATFGWRGASGYVVQSGGTSAYFAGDTAYFSGFQDIGHRLRPQLVLLPIAGYLPYELRDSHMSPLDALFAFEDLGADVLVPIGYGSFPLGYEPLEEPLRWLEELCVARGYGARLAALRHGETFVLRPVVDGRAPVG